MEINRRLDSILLKYNIIKEVSCTSAIKTIKDIEWNLISDSNIKIALYGVGIEAECLLAFIRNNTDYFKIDYCFDKIIRTYKYKEIIKKMDVSPIETIISLNVDCVIIGSYAYRKVFAKTLSEIGYHGQIIDLYSQMEGYIKDHFADYQMIYNTSQAYLTADDSDQISLLQELIKEHLLIKDFLNAFRYIDRYVEKQYYDYTRYIKLKDDINALLLEIRKCIKNRNKKDIIINWIDALSYYDINKFPFLSKKIESSVCFENVYTVMPWTTETTKTILFGEYPIEGKLFLRDFFSSENTQLLKVLDEKGYGFGYCGMPKMAKMFDETIFAPVGIYDNKYSGSLQKQWDALNILCQSDVPMCVLIHTLRETHEPFICGEGDSFILFGSTERDWIQDKCKEQAKASGRYINEQLEFYEGFYRQNAIDIYMSDHGRIGNSPMNDNKIHTILLISGRNIENKSIKRLFSLVRFPALIKEVIEGGDDWISLTDDYVLIENLDAYDERAVQDTLSGRLTRNEMYQCRGIVTLEDRYYLYAYGKEYYYRCARALTDPSPVE